MPSTSRRDDLVVHDFDDLVVNHVEFYVTDAHSSAAYLVDSYGFEVFATSGGAGTGADHYSLAVRQARVVLVLTEAISEEHPAGLYVRQHGDGVADIGLRTKDVTATFEAAVARGARALRAPAAHAGGITATIGGFGDIVHTLVEEPVSAAGEWRLPGFVPCTRAPGRDQREQPGVSAIDHFAVCLRSGDLDPTVEFYQTALGFRMVFEERIVVGTQAMLSKVVQSGSGDVTFTMLEPDPTAETGQIDDFLKAHDGAGVQHIALVTDDIVRSIAALGSRDVEFLNTPAAYYRLLAERLTLAAHSVEELKDLDILVDSDHNGQLFQIFARSVHPRHTYFMEIIERMGATTFGSGNIKALYEAVETERLKNQELL